MKFKIATKIGILASILVLITAVVIGKVAERETIRYNLDNEVETTYRDKLLVDKVPFARELIEKLLFDVQEEAGRDINGRVILSHLAGLAGLPLKNVDDLENARDRPWEADWKEVLVEDVWKKSLQNKRDYLDISLIDKDGREILRVHSQDGRAERCPSDQLRTYSGKDLVTQTIELGKLVSPNGETLPVFLSNIELERGGRDNTFLTPLCPVIRAAAPIYTPTRTQYPGIPDRLNPSSYGKVFGVVAVTMKLERILDRLAKVRSVESDAEGKGKNARAYGLPKERIYVTDGNGYFLSHPDSRKLYGMEKAIRREQTQKGIPSTNIVDIYPQLRDLYDTPEKTGHLRILHAQNAHQDEGYFVKARIGPRRFPRTIGLAMWRRMRICMRRREAGIARSSKPRSHWV